MMKITKKARIAVATLAVLAMSVVALPGQVLAAPSNSVDVSKDTAQAYLGNNKQDNLMATLNTIINVAIGLIGFVAVVIIIYGGFQYTTSAGDAGKVKKAKDTIMYGVIGLVIALLAFAIVNFVLAGIFGS